MGWDYPGYMYRLEDKRLESSPLERGGLVSSKLNMSQQCATAAQRANHTLGCTRPSTATRRGGGRGVVRSALCCAASPPALTAGWVSQYKKDITLSESPKEGYKDGEVPRDENVLGTWVCSAWSRAG